MPVGDGNRASLLAAGLTIALLIAASVRGSWLIAILAVALVVRVAEDLVASTRQAHFILRATYIAARRVV